MKEFSKFISIKGRTKEFSHTAYLNGSYLSGLLENTTFKVDIEDGDISISVESSDDMEITEDMIKRFEETLKEAESTLKYKEHILKGYKFLDKNEKPCLLAITKQSPISKLRSKFKEDEPSLSKDKLSKLNSILSEIEDEVVDESYEEKFQNIDSEDNRKKSYETNKSFINESFNDMKMVNKENLKNRKESLIKKIESFGSELNKMEQYQLNNMNEDLKLIENRLKNIESKVIKNGITYFVSEKKNDGCFKIMLSNNDNLKINEEIRQEFIDLILSIDDSENIEKIDNSEFKYKGKLDWHELNDKLINLGFIQNAEFNKMCGSNSYKSKQNI